MFPTPAEKRRTMQFTTTASTTFAAAYPTMDGGLANAAAIPADLVPHPRNPRQKSAIEGGRKICEAPFGSRGM